MRCGAARALLAESLAGELDAARRDELAVHTARCAGCAAERASLEATLALLAENRPPVPPRTDPWARLEPALDAVDAERVARAARWSLRWPVLVSLAAAAIVLLSVALGVWLTIDDSPVAPQPRLARAGDGDGVLETRVVRYVERAKPLLYSLANRDAAGASLAAFDLPAERRLARELAREGRTLGPALASAGLRHERALVGDLEVVFMHVANTPERRYRSGLGLVQDTITRRAILLEVGLQDLRRAGGPQPRLGAPA